MPSVLRVHVWQLVGWFFNDGMYKPQRAPPSPGARNSNTYTYNNMNHHLPHV